MLLVQSVWEHYAHIVGHGKKNAMFKLVLSTFIAHVPCRMLEAYNKPSVKTLRDKLESLVKNRKEINSCNDCTSGIIEDMSELDQILDDLILQREEVDEDKNKSKWEATKRENSL